MTKGMGKVLLEMKKAGKVISETAGEVGTAIGVASIDIADKTKKSVGELSDRAKKSAKIAMLKAEIDDMYKANEIVEQIKDVFQVTFTHRMMAPKSGFAGHLGINLIIDRRLDLDILKLNQLEHVVFVEEES